MSTLPLLPTTVVGSHGKPGWWFTLVKAHEAGEAGPADLEEMFDQLGRLVGERRELKHPAEPLGAGLAEQAGRPGSRAAAERRV